MDAAAGIGPQRRQLACGNRAHGFAACAPDDKAALRGGAAPNLGIVSACNDMLSAHQPFERYPFLIRNAACSVGASAQVAGGVLAMCDGVTQGHPDTRLRDALTAEAMRRVAAITALGDDYRPIGRIIGERVMIAGVVGLHATGDSTTTCCCT